MSNEIINYFLSKGYLINPDFINNLPEEFSNEFSKLKKDPLKLENYLKDLINKGILNNIIEENIFNQDTKQEPSTKNLVIDKEDLYKDTGKFKECDGDVIILKEYKDKFKKREFSDFVNYFRNRFDGIKKILINRSELQDLISINKLKYTQENKKVVIMGLVSNKNETKVGNIILELEDITGKTKLIVNKNKGELHTLAKDLVLDEVIGVTGLNKEGILFVDNILHPDISSNQEIKKSPDESYAVFISDVHYGLKNFLERDFKDFISWLNCEYGSDTQREAAKKVKYLFIVGDLVEGVGIYPNQDEDLAVKDICVQYENVANLLAKIPEKIKIIICAGNHDAIRISEPQPKFDVKFAKPLFDLKNVVLVTNPAVVNIHSSKEFPGFNVLLYHGFSFPYYAENVESIRLAGGQSRSDLIMHFLLKRRHLSPTHGSNLYIPDFCEDSLIIDKIPDFFVSGHIHKISVSNYKNIVCVNASCWVTQTEDQEKRGIIPEPSRAVVVNLKTREIKIMNFGK